LANALLQKQKNWSAKKGTKAVLCGKKLNAGNKFAANSGLIRLVSYSDRQFYKFTILIQLEVFKIKYPFSKISFE
jgi:hypothetical protein